MAETMTLGLLVAELEEVYQGPIWRGVAEVAREHGANLLCFVCGNLRAVQTGTRRTVQTGTRRAASGVNTIDSFLRLVRPSTLDGLIIVSSSLGSFCAPEVLHTFCQRFEGLPMISIGECGDIAPSVVVDNRSGVCEAMAHLIELHGRRRIAFIRGPERHPEAEQRYSAYVESLAEHNLPFDPALVVRGNFQRGDVPAQALLEGDAPHFDALLATNDVMALGAMEVLQQRGIRVPDHVAVVGFDDVPHAALTTPPLATVRQPIAALGRRAASMLLSWLAGGAVPDSVCLPTTFVPRRSCGCLDLPISVAAHRAPSTAGPAGFAALREDLLEALRPVLEGPEAARFLDALAEGLTQDPAQFFMALDRHLNRAIVARADVSLWHEVLSAMQHRVQPVMGAARLWEGAQVLVGRAGARVQAHARMRVEDLSNTMRGVIQDLIAAFDMEQLTASLARALPHLDIDSAYLVLYATSATQAYADVSAEDEALAMMILAVRDGQRILAGEMVRFPSARLLPAGVWPTAAPYALVVEPLAFQGDALGFAVFEPGPAEGYVYDTLRAHLSSALKGALLLRAFKTAYQVVEGRVQEHIADLKREVTERERAEIVRAVLYRISEAAHTARSLDALFRSIHEGVGALIRAENFYIALYDAGSQIIRFPYHVDARDARPAPQPPGRGLTAYVLKTQTPLLASPDVFADLQARGEVEVLGTQPVDWLGVPLIAEGQPIGVLAVQSYDPAVRFDEDDKSLLVFVSNQVAMAITRVRAEAERAQLLAALQHRSTQLQTAAEVSKSAITLLDPAALVERAVRLIQERFAFYYVGLFLVDQEAGYAVLQAGTGEAGQRMLRANHRLKVGGDSMIGWCTARGAARIALDVGAEAIRFENPWLPLTRSEMALPLISHTQGCIGALTVQSAEPAAFSEDDIVVLQSMADHLAVAIENARLYAQVQRYAAELEMRVAERTAELVATNRELASFSYSVSHDLRAPLRSIDGFSQALLEDYGERLDAVAHDYLRRVRRASQRMGQLIDDLLMLSRLTRGELRRETVDLSALASEIAAELQERAPERAVTFEIAPDLSARGDARLLRIALENLLGNAWKFTRAVPQARIVFDAVMDGGEVIYRVRDNGVGFDMAYADKLFAAFQRLHTLEEFEGTGIGLATVQRVIHRHGGRIWAEGQVGEGATFFFALKGEIASS